MANTTRNPRHDGRPQNRSPRKAARRATLDRKAARTLKHQAQGRGSGPRP